MPSWFQLSTAGSSVEGWECLCVSSSTVVQALNCNMHLFHGPERYSKRVALIQGVHIAEQLEEIRLQHPDVSIGSYHALGRHRLWYWRWMASMRRRLMKLRQGSEWDLRAGCIRVQDKHQLDHRRRIISSIVRHGNFPDFVASVERQARRADWATYLSCW